MAPSNLQNKHGSLGFCHMGSVKRYFVCLFPAKYVLLEAGQLACLTSGCHAYSRYLWLHFTERIVVCLKVYHTQIYSRKRFDVNTDISCESNCSYPYALVNRMTVVWVTGRENTLLYPQFNRLLTGRCYVNTLGTIVAHAMSVAVS